jgi:hypothetical protein
LKQVQGYFEQDVLGKITLVLGKITLVLGQITHVLGQITHVLGKITSKKKKKKIPNDIKLHKLHVKTFKFNDVLVYCSYCFYYILWL